jgi:large subunit ribosomal protein L25
LPTKLSERPAPEQLSRSGAVPNPFLPHRNPQSGRWAPPKYSLRRQADLIKHARASGTLHLLPPGPKMSLAQLAAAAATASSSSASAAASHPAADRASEEVKVSGLTNRRPAQNSSREEDDVAWTGPVEWVGNLRERSVAGADVGNRLYAGKKRMFKGHKWERTRERRVTRTKILLRDMDKRVERFKQVRVCCFCSSHFLFMVPPFPSLTLFFFSFFFSHSTVRRASRCRWQGDPICSRRPRSCHSSI